MDAMSARHDVSLEDDLHDARELEVESVTSPRQRSALRSWLLHDSPYITMLLLALVGVVLRLPAGYWLLLTPLFGVICVVAGWRQFESSEARRQMLYALTMDWLALIVAIYVLTNTGVQGVLNANASSLALMTLLGLGTFVAGVQARVWRIGAVGAILLLAVPAMGWVDQSALLLVTATAAVIAIGGVVWWFDQRRHGSA
jgi:hypothetical protein